jgi:hypothetical protein
MIRLHLQKRAFARQLEGGFQDHFTETAREIAIATDGNKLTSVEVTNTAILGKPHVVTINNEGISVRKRGKSRLVLLARDQTADRMLRRIELEVMKESSITPQVQAKGYYLSGVAGAAKRELAMLAADIRRNPSQFPLRVKNEN